jgi:hypothetical protein
MKDQLVKAQDVQTRLQDTIDDKTHTQAVLQEKYDRTSDALSTLRSRLKSLNKLDANEHAERKKMEQQIFADMQDLIEARFDAAIQRTTVENDLKRHKLLNANAELKFETSDQHHQLKIITERCDTLEVQNRKLAESNADMYLMLKRSEEAVAARENRMNMLKKEFEEKELLKKKREKEKEKSSENERVYEALATCV